MVFALVLGLAGTTASAAEVYRGSFDLPSEAYWGNTLLQPGQYSFSVEMDISRPMLMHLRGEGISTTFFTGNFVPEQVSEAAHLTLEQFGGVWAVRGLDAGLIGKSFTFSVPKSIRNRALRASAGQHVTVPVSSSAAGF